MQDERKTKKELIGELRTLRQQLADLRGDKQQVGGSEEPGQSLPFLKAIVESSITGIYVYDFNEGINVYINPQYTQLTGYTLEAINALEAEEFFALFHPEDQAEVAKHMEEVAKAADGEVIQLEYRFKTADGRWTWLLSGDTVFERDDTGKVSRFMGTFIDISDRKETEERIVHQVKNLTALRNIDLAIAGSVDLSITANIILDQIISRLRVDAASILLLDAHTNILKYLAGRGFLTPGIQNTRLRIGQGFGGEAALERKKRLIPDLSASDHSFARADLLEGEDFVSYYAVPLVTKGYVVGLLDIFTRSRLEPDEEWTAFLEALQGQTAIAIENALLFDDLQRANLELEVAYDSTLEGWVKALDLKDDQTKGHTQRVTELASSLAVKMGVSRNELIHVHRGALLHDIGKMGIPDSILLKPGELNDEETEIMKQHPGLAYEWLHSIPYLRPALDIPYAHHEKWDGSGYPRGLEGDSIPLNARIFAVVDVWDALNSDRPYRKAWTSEKALDYIREQSGTHFDPQVVEAFLALIEAET